MGRYDTVTARNVWLPGAGVWACLPQPSDAANLLERDLSPSLSVKGNTQRCDDQVLHDEHTRKRRKASSPSRLCSRKDAGLDVENSSGKQRCLALLGADVDDSELGFGVGVDCQGASSSSQSVMCPICLGNIEESKEAVLQWCMHRFCCHCIEEWSQVRRVCPLCKAEFRGWFHGVQSNDEFQERVLPPIVESSTQSSRGDTTASQAFSRFHSWRDARRQGRGRGRRMLQPRRQGVAPDTAPSTSGRSVPFPTQRSFGLPRQHQGAQAMRIYEEQAAAKALQWRKSIYNRNLEARRFEFGKRSMCTRDDRARAERRLEPWVHRELQAVLPNSDHDFLVRLVLGLWFGAKGRSDGQHMTRTRNATASTEVEGAVEKAIKELERFLGDKAELFWHEFRCFAESPFTMQAYDTVVVYTIPDDSRRPNRRTDGRPSHQETSRDSRRRLESTVLRSSSRPLDNEEPADCENDEQNFRAGRRIISHCCATESVQDSLGQHGRDSSQSSRALLSRDSGADQRKNRPQADVYSPAEDRWQLSYC